MVSRRGGLNVDWPALQAILPASDGSEPPAETDSDWPSITVGRVSVNARRIVAAPDVELKDIDFVASATVGHGRLNATLTRLFATHGDLPIEITGHGQWVDDGGMVGRLSGRLGDGRLSVSAEDSPQGVVLRATTDRLDTSRLHDSAPPSRLDLTVSATVALDGPRPAGDADVSVRGTIRPTAASAILAIRDGRVAVRIDGGSLRTTADISSSAGDVALRADLSGLSDTPRISSATVRARNVRLDRLLGDEIAGTLSATVEATGPVGTPSLEGTVDLQGLQARDLRVGDLQGRLSARLGSTGADLEWTRLVWTAPASTWTSTSGAIRYEAPRLSIPNVALTSGASSIRARGRLNLDAPFDAMSVLTLDLTEIDLSAFAGLHPAFVARPKGIVSGHVRSSGRRSNVEANLTVQRARLSEKWPELSGQVRAEIGDDKASVEVTARGPRWGRLTATALAKPPLEWRTAKGWRQGGLALLESIDANANIKLSGALPARNVGGTLKGRLSVGPKAERLAFDLRGRGVRLEGLPVLSRLNVTASSVDGGIQIRARANIDERPALRANADVAASLRDLLARPSRVPSTTIKLDSDRLPLALFRIPAPLAGASRAGAPVARPITGWVTLKVDGALAPDGERLQATLEAREVRLGESAPPIGGTLEAHVVNGNASAELKVSADELGAHHLQLEAEVPERFDPSTALAAVRSIQYSARRLSLAGIGALSGNENVSGRLNIEVAAGPAANSVTATIDARDVETAPGLAAIRSNARLVQTATQTTVRAIVDFGAERFLQADLTSELTVPRLIRGQRPADAWPVRAAIVQDRFPLRAALTRPGDRQQVDGRLSVRMALDGTFGAPAIALDASGDALRLGETSFRTFELHQKLAPDVRTTTLEMIQSDGGVLEVDVDATRPQDVEVDVAARAFSLGFVAALLNLMDAGVGIDGRLDGRVFARGLVEDTDLEGRLVADALRVVLPGAPPVTDGRLDIRLDGQRAVADLKARSGPGSITADVSADAREAPQLQGAFVLDDVQAAGGGQVVSIDLRGTVTGLRTETGPQATVVLNDGLIRLPDRSARELHPITNREDVVFRRSRWTPPRRRAGKASPTNPLIVRIRTAKPLGVRGAPVDAVFNLDLVGRPQPRGFGLSGTVQTEQGTVTLFGRRYTLQRAQIALGGQVPPRPRIDVLLSYEFDSCTLFVSLTGRADQPKLAISSEPAIYDDRQLLGFLFGGSPDEDNPDRTAQQQGIDAAASLLLGQLQAQLKKNLPIDTLAVDLGDGTDTGQANVSLGKWLTDRLFVAYTYRHGAAQTENTSEGLLRYRFLRSWLVELVFGDRGNGAADLLWTKRW